MTLKERLDRCLSELKREGGVEASAIVTREGLQVAADTMRGTDPEVFSAMAATMVGAAETSLLGLDRGAVQRVIVETPSGSIVAMGAGQRAVLVALARPGANLGALLLAMARAAEGIGEVL